MKRDPNRFPLFNPPVAVARKTDPAPSHKAAQKARNKAKDSRALVLAALRDAGCPVSHEYLIAKLKGRVAASGVRTRCRELVNMGVVEDSGLKGQTESGNECTLWRVVG